MCLKTIVNVSTSHFHIYIFTYYLSTYQRMSTMNIPQNFDVLKRVSTYLRHIFIYIINIDPSTYQRMSTTHIPQNLDL